MAVGYVILVLTGVRKTSFGESYRSWNYKPNLNHGVFMDKDEAENCVSSLVEDEKIRRWENRIDEIPEEEWEDFLYVLYEYRLKEVTVK